MNIGQKEVDPEYHMSLPEASTYADINSDSKVPPVTFQRINTYFKTCGKDFERKYQDMYNER